MLNDLDPGRLARLRHSQIYVAGHRGLVGSAVCRSLSRLGCQNILARTHQELDLGDPRQAERFFAQCRPEVVILCAAKVGGIVANTTYPADFVAENLAIQGNVIGKAFAAGVRELIFLGSSCIYPRDCPQPIQETALLTGPLEATNRPYAIAKIAGIEHCWSLNRQHGTRYLALMPTNLYGPGDNFDLETSHVLPALIRKFSEAKRNSIPAVTAWGTGTARREFLFSDDLGNAVAFLLTLPSEALDLLFNETEPPLINVGFGEDLSIRALVELVTDVVGFEGEVVWDVTRPDGTPRKLLDSSKIRALGWAPQVPLREGIERALEDFTNQAMAHHGMTTPG